MANEKLREQEYIQKLKYFASQEWIDFKNEMQDMIVSLTDEIMRDCAVLAKPCYSYYSILDFTNKILENYFAVISSDLVKEELQKTIDYNKSRFLVFPGLGESRDIVRYSVNDKRRAQIAIYQSLIQMEIAYTKNIGQDNETEDNSKEVGLDSSLWSGIGISLQ